MANVRMRRVTVEMGMRNSLQELLAMRGSGIRQTRKNMEEMEPGRSSKMARVARLRSRRRKVTFNKALVAVRFF